MKNNLCFALLLILALAACGGKKESSTTTSVEQPTTPQEAIKQVEKAMKQTADQQPVEPVNFRKLKELLPENVAGYERTNASGESAGAMGIKFSKAEGSYKNADGQTLRIQISDTGGLGMGLMSMAAWSTITVDKEDDNGYERTTTLNGYKCFEKYRKRNESSELSVLAESRFIINTTCRGCSMETLRDVVGAMDFNSLKNLEQ